MIQRCPEDRRDQVLDYFEQRFGILQNLFSDFEFYSGSENKVYLGPKKVLSKPKPDVAGLLIARISATVKPSTDVLQLFGHEAKRNYIVLTKDHVLSFIKGEDLELSLDDIRQATDGYVLVRYLDFSLGCGFLRGQSLRNMIPKDRTVLLKVL